MLTFLLVFPSHGKYFFNIISDMRKFVSTKPYIWHIFWVENRKFVLKMKFRNVMFALFTKLWKQSCSEVKFDCYGACARTLLSDSAILLCGPWLQSVIDIDITLFDIYCLGVWFMLMIQKLAETNKSQGNEIRSYVQSYNYFNYTLNAENNGNMYYWCTRELDEIKSQQFQQNKANFENIRFIALSDLRNDN